MNYNEVKKLCDSRKLQVSDIICHTGLTYQGLKKGLDTKCLSIDKLFALCEVLKLSPNAFFGWEKTMPLEDSQVMPDCSPEAIQLLREQLTAKDEQIARLHDLLAKK